MNNDYLRMCAPVLAPTLCYSASAPSARAAPGDARAQAPDHFFRVMPEVHGGTSQRRCRLDDHQRYMPIPSAVRPAPVAEKAI